MASIPLPALAIQQQPGPIDQYIKGMQLRQMQQQQQLMPGQLQAQQQELQAGQQRNQMNALALKSQQGLQKTISTWNPETDSIEDFPARAAQNGVLPQDIKPFIDMQESLTKTKSANLDFMQKRHSIVSDGLDAILDAPDDQLAQVGLAKVQELTQMGVLDGASAQKISQNIQQSAQNPAALRQQLQATEKALGLQSQMLAYAKDRAAIAKDTATAQSEPWKEASGTGTFFNVNTGEVKIPNGNVLSPQMADSKYRNIQQAMTLKQPVTDEERSFAKAYEKQKEIASTNTFNLNQGAFANSVPVAGGATGAAALAQMDPKVAAAVKMVGDYKQKSSEITQRMPPAAKANFLSALNAAYPNYDENEFPARNKMVISYTSGPESRSINAINTGLGHVGVLDDAIEALNNNSLKPLNALENKLGLQLDHTPAAAFNTIVHRVGPEIASAYIQGGGGEGERGTTAADFDVNLGPKTLHNNAAITAQLLRSKIGSLENQWTTTMKPSTPDQQFQSRFITPAAQATLDKLSPQSGGAKGGVGKFTVTDPNGLVHPFETQALADEFKKRAGIK